MRAAARRAMVAIVVVANALAPGNVRPAEAADRLAVTATTGQVADMARHVGGDRVKVTALMGPGVDPHLYSPSEGDLGRLFDADVILFSGLNLEGRLAEVLGLLGEQRPVVAVTDPLPRDLLIASPEYPDEFDPHVWGDPSLWLRCVERVYAVLSEADPEGEAVYRANADAYTAQLAALDAAAAARMATIPEGQRVLVTAHDAFAYFGRRFGLEVVGLQGISTDTEAGVSDLQRVANLIAERNVPAIFVESSVSPATIEAVQAAVRDRGAEVVIGGELYSDALGDDGTPEGTYVGMLQHNIETIVTALGGAPSPAPPPA